MGGARTGNPACQAWWQQADGEHPRSYQRHHVYSQLLSTGCQWHAIPKDLPHKSTVHDYFDRWRYDRTLDRIHHALYVKCREHMDREASPTAAVIDSQSVKSAEKGGARSIRTPMTRARKSKARSGTSSSIRKG